MRSYWRVLLSVSAITAALAVAVLVLRNTDGQALLSAVIAVEALLNIAACVYIGRLNYRASNGHRLWVVQLMFTTALMGTISTLAVGYPVARRFLGLPPLDAGQGLLLVGIGLVIGSAAPLTKALVLFLADRDSEP